MEQVRRKQIRLPASVYEAGWYFVTICTKDRENLLSVIKQNVGADDSVRPYGASAGFHVSLTEIGKIVEECLVLLNNENEGIRLDKYVIMPNHVHAVIQLEGSTGGQSRPPLQRVMQRFKSITTRRCWVLGRNVIWQRSFYDHVIRNEQEYLRVWQYIDDNPANWAEDEYYTAL